MSNLYNNDYINSLNQSKLTPNGNVFKTIWPILYTLMIYSYIKIYYSNTSKDNKQRALIIMLIQLFLNISWIYIFYKKKNIKGGLIIMILLLLSIIFMIYQYQKVNKTAAYIQLPYLIWVCFALYLNYYIVKYN